MTIMSTILQAVGRRKHPAIEQFEKDVAFFRDLRQKIQSEEDVQKKQTLLGEAAAALKDAKYNSIAKMVLAEIVDEKTDWDQLVEGRAKVMAQSLGGNKLATDYGATIMQRAQQELPILTRNILGLAAKGVISAKGRELLAGYQRESGNVQEARVLWQRASAEQDASKRQAIHAGIWTRAMKEQLSPVIRLEMIDPKSALVAQWKQLAERMARGDDVSQDLAGLKKPIENALTLKLKSFAEATFGVAV